MLMICFSIADCPTDKACVQQKCRDVCAGACGSNTQCRVIHHSPQCTCLHGYQGDPFSGCTPIPPPPIEPVREEVRNPCVPSPCGPNAKCVEKNGAGACVCLPEYFGDPYTGCRPECVINSDCPSVEKACIRNKCVNPCIPSPCGYQAECVVVNHVPTCNCLPSYTGDPFSACSPIRKFSVHSIAVSLAISSVVS